MRIVLISILAVATLAMLAMGMVLWLRRRALLRLARQLDLSFFAEDPLDIPQRYAAFELVQSGHGVCGDNVLQGRRGRYIVRVFDFRLEAGHGPKRLTRQFLAIAVHNVDVSVETIVWRGLDARPSALPSLSAEDLGGGWQAVGSAQAARRIVQAWPADAAEQVGVQFHQGVAFFDLPGKVRPEKLAGLLDAARLCAEALDASSGRSSAGTTH